VFQWTRIVVAICALAFAVSLDYGILPVLSPSFFVDATSLGMLIDDSAQCRFQMLPARASHELIRAESRRICEKMLKRQGHCRRIKEGHEHTLWVAVEELHKKTRTILRDGTM